MKSIEIVNFKNFRHLNIDNLGFVNLIVGKNNAGKSTLLEAISVLASGANIGWIRNLFEIRGLNARISSNVEQPELFELENFCSLYHNRDYDKFKNIPIRIESTDDSADGVISNTIEIRLVDLIQVVETDENGSEIRRRILSDSVSDTCTIIDGEQSLGLQISFNGNRIIHSLGNGLMRRSYIVERNIPFEYVRTAEFTGDKNPSLFDKVALSPLEPVLIEALRIIDPHITALNFLNDESRPRMSYPREADNRVPFVILDNSQKKYRLSTMGDGINRILTIILSMINCRNGILLVDEFENGLHYSVQTALWELICRLANDLNIQVFATTHGQDCIKSFLKATRDNSDSRLIRIEKRDAGDVAVIYDETDELEYIFTNDVETR